MHRSTVGDTNLWSPRSAVANAADSSLCEATNPNMRSSAIRWRKRNRSSTKSSCIGHWGRTRVKQFVQVRWQGRAEWDSFMRKDGLPVSGRLRLPEGAPQVVQSAPIGAKYHLDVNSVRLFSLVFQPGSKLT